MMACRNLTDIITVCLSVICSVNVLFCSPTVFDVRIYVSLKSFGSYRWATIWYASYHV